MRVETDQVAVLNLVHGERRDLAAEQTAGVVPDLGVVTLVDARNPLALPPTPARVEIELGDAAEVELLALLERELVGIDLIECVTTASRFSRNPRAAEREYPSFSG